MTGTVFILFLAAMEMMGTINTILALYFTDIFGNFGFNSNSRGWCKFFGALATMNGNVNWFTTGLIAVTRALGLTHKGFWQRVCSKTNVGLLFTVPWIWGLALNLPSYVDPSIEYGFNCQLGSCDYVPTGEKRVIPQLILQVTLKHLRSINNSMAWKTFSDIPICPGLYCTFDDGIVELSGHLDSTKNIL